MPYYKNAKNVQKFIAAAVLTTFLVSPATTIFAQPSTAFVQNKINYEPTFDSVTQKISDLSELGHIDDQFRGDRSHFLILIRDAHTQTDAQMQMARLIRRITQEDDLVLIEGTPGKYSVDYFKEFPVKDKRDRVLKDLLENNKITGPEFAAMTHDQNVQLVGIDDENLYLENLRSFQECSERQRNDLNVFEQVHSEFKRSADKLFSSEFKTFLKHSEFFSSRPDSILLQARFYAQQGERLKISFSDLPALTNIVQIMQEKLPPTEIDERLNQNTLKNLPTELDEAENRIAELLDNPTVTKPYLTAHRYFRYLEKALQLTLTPDEKEQLLTIRSNIYSRNNTGNDFFNLSPTGQEMLKNLESQVLKYIHFYDLAKSRDRYLVKNIEAQLNQRNKNWAVVIMGGYHSQNVLDSLRQKGISYLSIIPNFSLQSERDTHALGRTYRNIMLQSKSLFSSPSTASHVVPLSNVQPSLAGNQTAVRDLYQNAGNAFLTGFDEQQRNDVIAEWDQKTRGIFFPTARIPGLKNFGPWLFLSPKLDRSVFLASNIKPTTVGLKPIGFGAANQERHTLFVNNRNHIQGSVGSIEVNWRWHPDSNVILILAHKLGGTRHSLSELVGDISKLDVNASVVSYKSSRYQEARLTGPNIQDELVRVFGQKTFAQEVEDLRNVIRETKKIYQSRNLPKPPKIILVGQEYGGQLLPIVASEPEFSDIKHLILIRTPMKPLNEVTRELSGATHPILGIPGNIGEFLSKFSGNVDVILWRGELKLNESASEWPEYKNPSSSITVQPMGNGTFSNPTTVGFFQAYLRELTEKMARGFGANESTTPDTIRAEVEEAMLRWFGTESNRSNELELSRFLALKGEPAIDAFVSLIEEDRAVKLGPYKIPEYRNLDQLPEAGTQTVAPDGKSYTLPFDNAEFEQMRINLMSEIVIQRSLGREITVHVGTGHVAQANIALASEAQELLEQQAGRRFRGTIAGKERPYFSIAYQRPTSSSGYAVHFINNGQIPHPSTDQDMISNFITGRRDGVIAATFLPEVMAIADIVLVETEFEMHIPPRGLFQQARINVNPTVKLLETIGSLIRKETLVIIESTVQPGFVSKEALPALNRIMQERFGMETDNNPTVRLVYSPQRLAPGPDEMRSLRKFRRESATFSPNAEADLERYFRKIGFDDYKIWNVSEDVEFLKLLELAWFYDLLEILDGYLKAAEEFGVDAFKVIESIVRVHKRSRMGMRRVPNLCPGGSCTPEALIKIAMGLRTYFGMEDSQIFQIFQSRFLASSMLQQRANEVIWKLLRQFTSDMSVPFSEVNVGILGISYKEGIGNTKHSGSEHVVREITHFGGHVEATDPFTDFWPELAMQNPRSSSSQARGRLNQDDLNLISVRKLTDPLAFLHPELDALVFATRHFEYVGAHQPAYKRQEHPDVGGSRKAHVGLDPIKVVAHMMGLEDKVIVDTYDFFSDEDYRIFLALGWRIEAFGKGHIYKGVKPLAEQITPEERVGYLSALLKEFQTMRDESGIDQEKLGEAVRTTETRLAYWRAFITGEGEMAHLKLDYERLKAIQNLRYASGSRRKTAELEKELAETKLYHEIGPSSSIAKPLRSIKEIELDLSEWKKESKVKADEFLRSKVLSPIIETVSTALANQGRLATSIGQEMPGILSDVPAAAIIGLAQRFASLQHGILPQIQTLLESFFAASTFDGVRPDIARNERAQQARPDLRISERKPRVPRWAKKRARHLGFKGTFRESHIYLRNPAGKMERLTDPDGNSNRVTVKWVGDMQKGKKVVPDEWTKFSVEVPLNLVPVEDLQVELYEDFMELPWELREWLTNEVWGQGKILSTVAGEAQTKLRYMMEVNLDAKTVAPGRGGMLFWGDSGEPILIASDMGDEFIFDLKSAGSFVEVKGEEITARSGRVVQGGAGELNKAGQHVITRVDLGALHPGHQAGGESEVIHLLRLVGTDPYFNGDAPRALFRLRFRYPGNDTRFEIIGRASPTNQRIGHIFKGGNEDFDPADGARLMGWNAAEILTHHIADVHIALSPDNILSTGYYTDAGSNIDLFNERDPLKGFQKYFGYYLQLVAYDFNQAREFGKESYEAPTPSLDSLQDWLNAFVDHFLESKYVANKEMLQKLFEPFRNIDKGAGPQGFQYKNYTDPIQILTHVIDDLSDLLWQHYLPYQLFRNRLDMGYDATRESTYSTTSGHLYDPGSLQNAEQFLEAQLNLLTVAEKLIRDEGYPLLQQRGAVFDFAEARNVLEQKKSHLRSLSRFQFPAPARYAGIYQIPFYSPPRPEIFTVVDMDSTSSKATMHFRHAPIRSNGLFSKAPAGWLRDVEPAVRRIRQFAGREGVTLEGNFPVALLIQAYFDAWVHLSESTADLFELEKPWHVLLQIHKDFLNAGALGGDLDRLRTAEFKETFTVQDKYYARVILDNEEIFIEATTDGDKQSKLVDKMTFTAALTEYSDTAADISVSPNRPAGVGFGLELNKSLQLIGDSSPVILQEKGQEAIDTISRELGHILLPGSIGKKVGSLVIDDSLFLNRILEAGKSAQRTTNFILQIDGFKTIYLVDLPETSTHQRKLIAAIFGIPLNSIITLRSESNTFSLANHYGEPIVAALSGKHRDILRALQSYALLHPNTVLLLAGENFSSDEIGQLKRIGVRVFSMTNAMEMISDAMEMLEAFGQSA